jgi:hypothetical protein
MLFVSIVIITLLAQKLANRRILDPFLIGFILVLFVIQLLSELDG